MPDSVNIQPMRIAVCGAGTIGQRHIATIEANPACSLAAVIEPKWPKQDPAPAPLYAKLEDCLSDVECDGVIVASPTAMHVEHSLACINANMPVLVEKPIAADLDGAEQIVSAAKNAGVPVLVGHVRRHSLVIEKAKQLISEGFLGKVTTVNVTWWVAKPESYFATSWRLQNQGGPLLINAIHDLDTLRFLLGDIVKSYAIAAPPLREAYQEDTAAFILRFKSGTLGIVSVSDNTASPWSWELTALEKTSFDHPKSGMDTYLLGGTQASLALPSLKWWRHVNEPDWTTPFQHDTFTTGESNPLERQLEHFLDVIKGEKQPLSSAIDATESLRQTLLVRQKALESLDKG